MKDSEIKSFILRSSEGGSTCLSMRIKPGSNGLEEIVAEHLIELGISAEIVELQGELGQEREIKIEDDDAIRFFIRALQSQQFAEIFGRPISLEQKRAEVDALLWEGK